MKTQSKFKNLPLEDQQRVIDLCNQHDYHTVLEIISKPRPEGLQLQASYSALCRFYCSWNEDARKASVLNQAASSLQIARQQSSGATRAGILAFLENRIFEALREGRPVADLQTEFSVLKDFHKGFLSEEKWRLDPESKPSRESAAFNSQNSSFDFIRLQPDGSPAEPEPLTPDECEELIESYGDDDSPADLTELDYVIASSGPTAAKFYPIAAHIPEDILQKRLNAHRKMLRSLDLCPVAYAEEARLARVQNRPINIDFVRYEPSEEPVNIDQFTQIHPQPPVNPPNPPKSTEKISPPKTSR